jgi:hypothetical protein
MDQARELIEKLGSDDPAQVAKATEQLKALGPDAADELATGLDEEKVQVKKACAQILKDLGPAGKEAVNTLTFKLQDTDDKLGRKLAVQVLENLGPDAAEVAEDLVLRLDDEDKVLRRISLDILKKMGKAYKDTTPDLVNYLTHDEKTVRNYASELLIALGIDARQGAKDLAEIIDETPVPNAPAAAPANDMDSKIRAANVLASIAGDAKEALPSLKKFENDKDPDLQAAVKTAIAKISEGKPSAEKLAEQAAEIPGSVPKPETAPGAPQSNGKTGENF